MVKRKGVAAERGKGTKATKTIRTYSPNSRRATNSSCDYDKERDERREDEHEYEQDNLDEQDEDTEEDNNRQVDDDIERLLLDQERERKERERREKERKEKERKEKERRDKERRDKEKREKDKEQEENENVENENKEEIPFQFGAMTNQLQICNWLVLHPSILPDACGLDNYRLIDEEMKCLFLRTRNPPDHAFDKITQKIFGHDAYQSVAKSINKQYCKSFSDYRYQLKNVLSTLAKEF
ncbi:unnamed protein product [Rhizophagus irregularis]|nr:unnamed protein product [Rhizophagus irregularis]